MALLPGVRLGPYEIRGALGSGGMGEVYRARDTRLEREVAIKVLPTSAAADPERLRRFETEARAAGALDHPNLLVVHDVGSHDGTPFLVTELLEGETLRERLRSGHLGVRRALEYAVQIGRGLAAAHDKGIVHRDLKPENLFVTRDARVKILDFGLAKLRPTPAEHPQGSENETLSALTGPGVVLGTVGYMSPEQVQGCPADHRSDIFAFGAVLYEMLSGRLAFGRATRAETLTAILREEPAELGGPNPVPPALERVVRRCLEKKSVERFQSARDLAFALDALSAGSGASPAETVPAGAPHSAGRRSVTFLGVVAACVGAGLALGRLTAPRLPILEYELLTDRPASVTGAAFSPDGASILYSVAEGASPPVVTARRLDAGRPVALELPPASVLSVSSKGEAALLLTSDRTFGFGRGTLARVPLSGGTPRPVLDAVSDADWGPDGESLCVVRQVDSQWRLEYPIGTVLVREFAQFPRVSPDGQRVAFKSAAGGLEIVDRAGVRRRLGSEDLYSFGLAWRPDGHELWITGSDRLDRALWAVDLTGKRRLLARGAGSLTLLDVATDGRALVVTGFGRLGLRVLAEGQLAERELETPARSAPVGLTDDGRHVLVREFTRGAAAVNQARLGARGEALLVASDGSSVVRLAPGQALALSPDGKRALCLQGPPPRLMVVPTGPGESRPLPTRPLQPDGGWGPARWAVDGRTLFVAAREPGRARRIFARHDDSGEVGDWRPVTPEGIADSFVLSPDGGRLATTGPGGLITLYSVDGSPPAVLAHTQDLEPVHWTGDDALYVRTSAAIPAVLEKLEIRSGRRQPLRELMPSDPNGVNEVQVVLFTPSGRSYAYSYNRSLNDLYLVRGLQ